MVRHEEDAPNSVNIKRQLLGPPRTRSKRKYPNPHTFAFLFTLLIRLSSIAITPDIKRPQKRAKVTLSIPIARFGGRSAAGVIRLLVGSQLIKQCERAAS